MTHHMLSCSATKTGKEEFCNCDDWQPTHRYEIIQLKSKIDGLTIALNLALHSLTTDTEKNKDLIDFIYRALKENAR